MVEQVVFSNMCMIVDGNRILVQNRVDKNWSGYVFPGGHVETCETFCQSVIREVYEETGLTISNPVLCGIKHWQGTDNVRNVVLLYKTSGFSGTLKASDEGQVFWMDLSELQSSDKLADSFDTMLKVFLNDNLSEHTWLIEQSGIWLEIVE